MQSRKGPEGLSVVQAVDNLSYMAELDLISSLEPKKTEGMTQEQIQERMKITTWLDPSHALYNQERIKETFQVILAYLKGLLEKDKAQLSNEQTQRGIQAIVLLATEAAEKLDRCTDIFTAEDASALQLKEYKELMKFYQTKVLHRYQAVPESYTDWREEWGKGTQDELLNIQKRGLSDLTAVRQDKEYELFYVRREDGHPFFNRNLLRHIQLVGKFDSLIVDPSRDDLFLRMKALDDRECYHTAQEILHMASLQVEAYFKEAMKHKQMGFVAAINQAIMALMLAANTANLIQNTTGKSARDYFADFHLYLRKGLQSDEYRQLQKKSSDRFHWTLLNMTHTLCSAFFLNSPEKKEAVKFIHMLIERGEKETRTQKQTHSPLSLLNNLADEDEHLRKTMRHYPSGPLLKTLDVFNTEKEMSGFDSFHQGNHPCQLYTLSGGDMHVTCLHLPAPLSQQFIRKADVIPEFHGFLRSLEEQGGKHHHLLINMQDRTSWQEHARCVALEEISHNQDKALTVVTLPKNGDFYWQSALYFHTEDAASFIRQFKEQIASGEQCGFHFPKSLKAKELNEFIGNAMGMIHKVFFASKEVLTHKNRLDFIEIFYLLFSLKMVEMSRCDSVSFTCKDAIDTGRVHSCEQYLFLRMINTQSPISLKEKDFLYWMLYSPALMHRWRAVDIQVFNRMRGALGVIGAELEAHRESVITACKGLFDAPFFKSLELKLI